MYRVGVDLPCGSHDLTDPIVFELSVAGRDFVQSLQHVFIGELQ